MIRTGSPPTIDPADQQARCRLHRRLRRRRDGHERRRGDRRVPVAEDEDGAAAAGRRNPEVNQQASSHPFVRVNPVSWIQACIPEQPDRHQTRKGEDARHPRSIMDCAAP